jgi:signal transduction histidine kinase/class 3 adenylate cyclase
MIHVIVAMVVVLSGCSNGRENSLQKIEAHAACVGDLDACSKDGAAFVPLPPGVDLGPLLPERGLGANEALTLAYAPDPHAAILVGGEGNPHRVRGVSGDRSVEAGAIALAPGEWLAGSSGDLLVEVRLGADRSLWRTDLLTGTTQELLAIQSRSLVAPLLLMGWMLLATLQQLVAPRRSSARVGAYAVALLTFAIVLRIASLQVETSGAWGAHGALRRGIEVGSMPLIALGAAGFYRWLVGASFRTTLARVWLVTGVALLLLTPVAHGFPPFRGTFLLAAQLYVLASGAYTAHAIATHWRAMRRDELTLVVLGVVAVLAAGFLDIAVARSGHPQLFAMGLAPLGLALETLCQALILSRRDARAHLEVTRLVIVAKEASERALAEQGRVNAELTRLDALKDAFIANTSHELRTPLNGVIGLSEALLAREDDLPPRTKQGLATILASGKRLDRLVSDLLDFSKAKAGEMTIEFGAVDLATSSAEVLLLLAPIAGAKGLRIVSDVAPNFPLARADETRVAQVLHHVVGNALKFTEQGEVRIGAERRGARLVLTVKDTGPGIEAERIPCIFAAFEQGDGSATRSHGGTGLGLAFAKQLMTLQGGDVTIASVVGDGVCVELEFVAAPPAAQQARRDTAKKSFSLPPTKLRASLPPAPSRALSMAPNPRIVGADSLESLHIPVHGNVPNNVGFPSLTPSAPRATGARARVRVLIADDEPVNLERLRMDLDDTGYDLVCVTDGRAAVDAFDNDGPFDLVLLDVMMPRLDGLGACRAIRERAAANAVPVILVTAKREAKDLQAGFDAGASDYLTKPYVRQELLERTKAHLRSARMSRAVQRYVPIEFAKLLGRKHIDELEIGDCVEKELAILFMDIKGFTSASERMTPRHLFAWLNAQFGAVVPIVERHGGFVDKFVGDAMMALFPKGPIAALDAATAAVSILRREHEAAEVGIGIHFGSTMVGAIGAAQRFSPTVVSDTVNVAARLESLTRRFDSQVLVSEEAVNAAGLGSSGRTRYLGAFRVKGRDKALRVHELLDAELPAVADTKRIADATLSRMHRELNAGDLAKAMSSACEGMDAHPGDEVFVFYMAAIDALLATGRAYEGAIELREK